jgi:ArsR family transcriptional regulator
MENTIQDIERLKLEFQRCQKIFTALGDETRQYLLCMMLSGPCGGSRVVDLASRTNLSRPAISHHMQILKDAGIVQSRKEGTLIYYYLDPQDGEIEEMIRLFTDIQRIMKHAPDRSESGANTE